MKTSEGNKVFILFISFLLTSRMLDFEIPIYLYYTSIFVTFILFIFSSNNLQINSKLLLFFIFSLFVSIVLNDIPVFFKPYERYLSFLLNILVFSPLFINKKIIEYRLSIFNSICIFFITYTLISFFGLMFGIYPILGFGGFQGITVHAITMSIVASISLLSSLRWYYEKKRKVFLYIAIVSFIVVILGASRAALLALIIGIFIFLLKMYKLKSKTIIRVLMVGFLFYLTIYFLPNNFLSRIETKFEKGNESGNIYRSRELLWKSRIDEFKTSPFIGIGFGNMIEEFNDYGINEKGGIETGTSWGMVLSMSGIFGFSIFLFFIIQRIKILFKSQNNIHNSFIASVFIFFLIDMLFEGYVFASGSIFMILFWLTTSMTNYLNTEIK